MFIITVSYVCFSLRIRYQTCLMHTQSIYPGPSFNYG